MTGRIGQQRKLDGLIIIGTPVEKLDSRVKTFSLIRNYKINLFVWHNIYTWDEYGEAIYYYQGFKDIGKAVKDIQYKYRTNPPDGYVLHKAAAFEFSKTRI
ncbi:hypothetical protein J7K43_02925 [Candidatus Calescamantes bacterium]|nr:hypothetical protein [Candidatus Calescamantes bacterium]